MINNKVLGYGLGSMQRQKDRDSERLACWKEQDPRRLWSVKVSFFFCDVCFSSVSLRGLRGGRTRGGPGS